MRKQIKMNQMLFLCLAAPILHLVTCEPDYYWRDYDGKIPADAVEGGRDLTDHPTYIGQAFVLNHGIIPGRIYSGQKNITTSKQGIHVTSLYNRILCSNHKENFSWLPVNATNFRWKTTNKHLVKGGTEWGDILNIGRAEFRGELIVGKVCPWVPGRAKLYFAFNNKEIAINSYEVLVYDDEPKFVKTA